MIVTSRITIKRALLAYGELQYADKVKDLTDDQVLEIGKMSVNYMADNNLIDMMLSLATVEFFEKKRRPLAKNRRDMNYYKSPIDGEDDEFMNRIPKINKTNC